MSKRNRLFLTGSIFLVLLLMVFAASCDNNIPTALENQNDLIVSFDYMNNLAKPGVGPLSLLEETCSERISAEMGGEILFPGFGAYTKFYIPPHSLSKDQRIIVTAGLFESQGKNIIVFEFWPNGLVFNVPAELRADAHYFKGSDLTLLWYDPEDQKWIPQATGSIKSGAVKFEIYHFSKYAISD